MTAKCLPQPRINETMVKANKAHLTRSLTMIIPNTNRKIIIEPMYIGPEVKVKSPWYIGNP